MFKSSHFNRSNLYQSAKNKERKQTNKQRETSQEKTEQKTRNHSFICSNDTLYVLKNSNEKNTDIICICMYMFVPALLLYNEIPCNLYKITEKKILINI